MNTVLESFLRGLAPSAVTELFLWLLLVLFALSGYWLRQGQYPTLTTHAPALLASLGILGTFVGIVVGLLDFDPSNLDQSIEGLLEGLKTAFISSIAGIAASLAFRGVEPFLMMRTGTAPDADVGPEEIVALLTEQKNLLQATRDAIAGSEESSLAGQLKLLRADLSDRRREDDATRKRFEAELWKRLQAFAEMLSKSATEQVVEALRSVIVDFNRNLTEQFGDNFRKLDASVQKLVEWQEGYRQQLEQLHALYDQSVRQTATIEASVARIAEHSANIPASMEKLDPILEAIHHEIEELERHLQAFAELRDRAIEAVPQTSAHVDAIMEEIAAGVRVANQHATALQNGSAEQLKRSQQMLERLTSAGEKMQSDVQAVQDRVADTITQMQSRVEAELLKVLNTQSQTTDTMVQTTLEQTRQAVSRTGEGVNKQLEALDEALARELDRVMQYMGNALTQITSKFVEDYTKLVQEMQRVVRTGTRQ